MLKNLPVPHSSLIAVPMMAILLGCSSDSSTTTSSTEPARLVWSACEGSATLECATLKVPVNYSQPEAETLEIALSRIPASGDQKEGSIVVNPGGPGGSGTELVGVLPQLGWPIEITERFDIVGFDPRGVGGSRPVDCIEFGENELDEYPLTLADVRNLEQQLTAFADACFEKYGDYLLHLGSNNVARDMDEIRDALGESSLRFVGYSYGSRLASLYAQLFPSRVGALVLDGSMPPDGGLLELYRDGMTQMQANLRSLLQSCTMTTNPCDDTMLLTQIQQRVNQLIAEEREDEAELFADVLFVSAEDPNIGEITLDVLREYVDTGDIAVLLLFLEQWELVTGESLIEDDAQENTTLGDTLALESAVLCADDPARPNADEIAAQLDSFNATSDLFAELYLADAAACMGWPAAIDPLQPISAGVDEGVMIIGGTSDAATPLIWSQQMSQALGSPLIVSDHLGHTVVFQQSSDCVDQQVIAFLTDGTEPTTLNCTAN